MKNFLFAFLILFCVGCGNALQPTPISIPLASSPRNILVDTDVSVDDILALLYLLSRPDVNVQAITIAGTGITRCDAGIRNVRAILETMERTDIPIACGRETPLQGNHTFPKEWRDAAETFFGANLQPTQFVTPNENAVALLTRTLQESHAPLTILALGPLTNLVDAFAQKPTLTHKIEMLYSMGGAVQVKGNVEQAPNAEWNFYIDPTAVERVFASGVPLTLVPLDATNHVPVTRAFLTRLNESKQTPAAKLAERVLQSQRGGIENGAYFIWDGIAAALVTDETLGTLQEMPLVIEPETGRTKQDAQGTRVRFATKMDAPRFEATFLQTLNRQFNP
jgi:pyrimidine-specific ribonucleoside hydrolase